MGKVPCIYLIRAENGLVKIGRTADLANRFSSLQGGSPIELELIWSRDTLLSDDVEAELHAFYGAKRVRGEWFRLSDQDLEDIKMRYGGGTRLAWYQDEIVAVI